MKKTLFISALVALAMTFVSCIDGLPLPPDPVTIDLAKDTTIEVKANHPWENGKQNTAVISNYQGELNLTDLFTAGLPVIGTKVTVKAKAKSDVDVKKICARLVDTSAAASYWTELNKTADGFKEDSYIIAKDVKADTAFDINVEFEVTTKPKEKVTLIVWYDVGDATPDGPAVLTVQ